MPAAAAGAAAPAAPDALADAVAQRDAIADILRLSALSPADPVPMAQAIARHAAILCRAPFARVIVAREGTLHELAQFTTDPTLGIMLPMPAGRRSVSGRAIAEARTIHLADVAPLIATEYPDARENFEKMGFRAALAVPLVAQGVVHGALFLWRREPGHFRDDQVALIETFARQAALALLAQRLFRETSEALEQKTATSEILRVIASSHADTQPVFDLLAKRAGSLCEADVAVISRYDGDLIELAAIDGLKPEAIRIVRQLFPMRPDAQTMTAWVVRRGTAVHFADILEETEYGIREFAIAAGYRGALGVPIVRDGRVVGVVFVGRGTPGRFSDSQVAIVQTFADQAGIAIENVRLFNELAHRNAALTEALEQQTATSEILRVISRSPRDTQPVFDTIARAALSLCAANTALVATYDGTLVHVATVTSTSAAGVDAVRSIFPRPPSPDNGTTRAIQTAGTVMIPDVTADPAFSTTQASLEAGFRSVLAVPLKRGEETIGCITVGRPVPGSFPDKQVALLQTFADQAVIAIENARLFRELEARGAQLVRSVDELRALSEVGQAVNSSLDLGTVLRTIVARARELTGMDGGSIYEYDTAAGEFHLHAADHLPQELVEALREARMRRGEGALGRMAVTGRPVQIHDVADAAEYQSRVRDLLLRLGFRSLLAVPLRRDERLLGGLVVNSARAGEFAPETIALLETFAAQSALAIQNARLFREVEEKGRQLETASRHKSEFLANMSHELRTPLNAIIGFSDVLAQRLFGEVNEKQAEYLADIMESGQHLLALINEVLDLSKIEAGRMEVEIAPFDVKRALEAALALVRERAQRRGVTLTYTCDPRLGLLQADERKVKQVLLNLLSNALKFTPEGGRVDVRGEIDGRYARISVADTGVGIAPADQDAVFEEFRQVGASSQKAEGTGLGLAIARKFVELHGGSMGLASAVGQGSTFWFTLPLG
ncbi:MAG: GAF domain-containing protein [Burkholderiales bacterium]